MSTRLFAFLAFTDPSTSFLVYQHCLLPLTRLLVRSVNTASPAAGSFLSFLQFFDRSRYTLRTGLRSFSVFNPTQKFVTPDRCETFPELGNF